MGNLSTEFLGNGLIMPLRRQGGADFISSSGVDLVRSCIAQIIGTQVGQLRWRPTFGLSLNKYTNKLNNDVFSDLLSDSIISAVHKFEPRVNIIKVVPRQSNNIFFARITWSLIDKNTSDNQVILGPDSFEVKI